MMPVSKESCQREVAALAAEPVVARALDLIRRTDAETIGDMLDLASIPAPTFAETKRATRVRDLLGRCGSEVGIDGAGNVLARIDGSQPGSAAVVLAAHLDTVFGAHVPVDILERDGRFYGPGISDNARGLAALVTLARVIRAAGVQPMRPIVLAATTGEEGDGDLYGVRTLFDTNGSVRNAFAFIAVDGAGRKRIVHRGVGARRLRVEVTGPGGHSWADRGLPNPAFVAGSAIARIATLSTAAPSHTAVNVGRIGGGTSVNAIPAEAWFELEVRAERRDVLDRLEKEALQAIETAVRAGGPAEAARLTIGIRVIGDRPAGETPIDAALVEAACAATTYCGAEPELCSASTDANVAMALGVPAVALGAGGESGRTHTRAEWYSNAGGPEGIQRLLLTVLALAGAAAASG